MKKNLLHSFLLVWMVLSSAFLSCRSIDKFKMQREWKYPGGDAPPMSMIFEENGTLRFEGGFLNYNPSRWRYDTEHEELIIHVPAFTDAELRVIAAMQHRHSVKQYDGSKKELHYPFNNQSEEIDFCGWIFSCDSNEAP